MSRHAPGTVYWRFNRLLGELCNRYKIDTKSRKLTEYLLVEQIDKERLQLKVLREAMETAIIAIDDFVNIYAEEYCDPGRVEEARQRMNENGTLYYASSILKQCKSALKENNENPEI